MLLGRELAGCGDLGWGEECQSLLSGSSVKLAFLLHMPQSPTLPCLSWEYCHNWAWVVLVMLLDQTHELCLVEHSSSPVMVPVPPRAARTRPAGAACAVLVTFLLKNICFHRESPALSCTGEKLVIAVPMA